MVRQFENTYYEVYLQRVGEESIQEVEWFELVASTADLELFSKPTFLNGQSAPTPAWRFVSLREPTPIFFEEGRVLIREDDAATIEKLVELAPRLSAVVEGEDGTEFLSGPSASSTASLSAGPSAGTKIPIHDELLRKRQSLAGALLCLLLPATFVWQLLIGERPSELLLWAIGSFAMSLYALYCFWKTKYYVQWAGGDEVILYAASTKSTDTAVARSEIQHREIDPLELIWFPLEYPSKTVIEYHVRSKKLPWLVFYAGYKRDKAQSQLRSLGQKLRMNIDDLSASPEAGKNVPKKYLLTEDEKRKKFKKAS